MNHHITPTAELRTPSLSRSQSVVTAMVAGALGLFLLWGVGFAGPEQIHNAAHDTRHSFVFPCH